MSDSSNKCIAKFYLNILKGGIFVSPILLISRDWQKKGDERKKEREGFPLFSFSKGLVFMS